MSYQIKHFNENSVRHSSIFLSRLTSYTERLIMNMDADIRVQLLIRYTAIVRHCRKNGNVLRQYVSNL
jgi:hypothetical protein